jgi:argininosuccinate synthase
VLSPSREWASIDQAQYAHARGIPFPPRSSWPADVNLWGRTLTADTEASGSLLPEKAYALTKSPVACPNEAAFVELSFDRDVPTAINGVPMPLVDLIGSLTIIAGAHGVGRAEIMERRADGTSIRYVCEAPAAILLHAAYRALRARAGTTRGGFADISRRYAALVRDGQWFTPLRAALDSSLDAAGEPVTGVVRLKLFKGQYQVHDNSMVRAF